MTNAARLLLIVLIGLSGIVYAKTDATRKSELTSLFGTSSWRIVYEDDLEGAPVLQKLDSTGKINPFLKTAGSNNHLPNFTIDGTRVVYINAGAGSVCIADWATGTAKTIVSGGYTGGDGDAVSSYKNSAGKDMVLCKPGNSSTVYLIDADNTSDKQTAYSGNLSPSYISISGDGKYIAADWSGYNTVGVYDVVNKSGPTYWPCSGMGVQSPNQCAGGCWLTIARDNTHNIIYTIEPHRGCLKINGTQKLLDKTFPFIQSGTEYNGLRWSNDQNFCSVYDDENQSANPYIVRLSDMSYVTLEDGLSTLAGHVGMHIGPASPVSTFPVAHNVNVSFGIKPSLIVDLLGRPISGTQLAKPGVYFEQFNASQSSQKTVVRNFAQ